MKGNKGITLIVLIFIVIVIGMVIFTAGKYINQYFENEKIEDIKTTMLSIQRVITSIHNKNVMDGENNALIGTKLNLENNETIYKLSEGLMNSLQSIEGAELYILSQEELSNSGIKDVIVNENEFYVVDYNSEEIFYSLGINGEYKLSEI